MVFVSSDKLHQRCAPLFLRADQTFVWGQDLKVDLQHLTNHYAQLPESEKEKGITGFAPSSPDDNECLVSKLWDRHLRPWRDKPANRIPRDPARDKDLIGHLTKFTTASPLKTGQVDFTPEDSDVLAIQRLVRKRKGSWWQVPKDLKETDDS